MNERVFLRVCVCVRVCVYIYIQLLATALSDSCAFLCVSGQELERFFVKCFVSRAFGEIDVFGGRLVELL